MKIKKIITTLAFASVVPTLVCSCAYRHDLNQGNYVEQDLVNQLYRGLNQDQVRYILGAPMLIDPYDETRWYYVCFKREGWHDPEIQNLVLIFNNDILVDIAGDFKKPTTFNAGIGNAPKSNTPDFELPEQLDNV